MTPTDRNALPLVMMGAGGHAKVLLALVRAAGRVIVGVCDPALVRGSGTTWRGVAVLGDDMALACWPCDKVELINGLGQLVGGRARADLFARLTGAGFVFPPLLHPAAWVAPDVQLAPGVQVMAGAVVQPDCRVGANSIVNTGARLDHDCEIGANVHIAPGATLCGGVCIGDGAFIGSGATLIQGVVVGAAAVVGAGVTVTRALAPGAMLRGALPDHSSRCSP